MQTFDFWAYEILLTEKSDFDWKNECYPWVQPFFCCKQMHSKLVHEWNPDWKNETEGDGLYSNQKGIRLKVGVSDCNAVAVMGKERFGIVHAGRKGLQLGIIENLIDKLQAKGESDFKVFLWPAIRKCCYEVGAEFSERCEAQYLIPQANGKFHLDMLGMIQDRLKAFPCSEIHIHPECTKCGKHFFSYRRKDGINNFILIRKK